MSVFNQFKKLFGSGSFLGHSEEAQSIKIRQDKNIKKSEASVYKGLEQYTLLHKLGEGAFSKVYEAIDNRTSQHVAIKIVRKFELNQIKKANVLKEVQIMRTLNHSSIVKLLSFIETKNYYFLVLELMNGGEVFHQIVHLTYFSEELARHCIRQVAEGIRYLHEERGVVHRDIKPENILFEPIPFMERRIPTTRWQQNEDESKEDEGDFVPGLGGGCIGKVKIADFGLSKVIWDKHTMTPCGTVGYTAPEIVKDERYSKSVDMWALGCVLYTMLCGFPPFYDENIATLTRKVAKGKYSFLSPWWDHISIDAKHLVQNLLVINPKKRYTINQFLAHPWMLKQDKLSTPISIVKSDIASSYTIPNIKREDNYSIRAENIKNEPCDNNTPYLLKISNPATTSVAVETISIAPSLPRDIPPQSSKKRKELFLSGITTMKEMFDVSYAVHRLEEEGVKHKENKNSVQQQTFESHYRMYPFRDPLSLVSDSDSDEENIDKFVSFLSLSVNANKAKKKDNYHRQTGSSLNKTTGSNLLTKQLLMNMKADNLPVISQQVTPSFDLNMNNATLLERRKNSLLVRQSE